MNVTVLIIVVSAPGKTLKDLETRLNELYESANRSHDHADVWPSQVGDQISAESVVSPRCWILDPIN